MMVFLLWPSNQIYINRIFYYNICSQVIKLFFIQQMAFHRQFKLFHLKQSFDYKFSIRIMKEKEKQVLNTLPVESQYSIQDTIKHETMATKNIDEIKQNPKKKLNGFVFSLNILSMMFFCNVSPYYIFAPRAQGQIKGIVAGCTIAITFIITFPTLFYLATLKKLIQLAFLVDTIMLVTISAAIAFVNMILMFDKGGTWHYPLIQISFSITIFLYSAMVRALLVTLDWSKWQLIVFKLHLMINCLMFFVSGVYFIYVDFTYTNHKIPSFDNKVHQFMVLFIFTMFGWFYELYSKVTDLDHTGNFKFIYKLKNVEQRNAKRKKQIIKKKKESIKLIRILEQSDIVKVTANQQKKQICIISE